MSDKARCSAVMALAGVAYFVSYPEDAQAIATTLGVFLGLTNAVAPGFYGVVAVGILAAAIVKTWGPTRKASDREGAPAL